jgi:polysaccharide biosynthesis transport protein
LQELTPYNGNRALSAQTAESWPNGSYGLSEADDQPSLWTYWSIIRRHLRLILGLFFLAELLTAAVVVSMTPIYTGLSTILIEDQAPGVLGNDTPSEGSQSETSFDSFYKTQYDILQSRSLAARVIKEKGLDHNRYLVGAAVTKKPGTGLWEWLWPHRHPPGKHDADEILGVKPEVIDSYLAHLTIRPEFGTRLVMIAFSSPDPVLSAEVANAHVRAYILEALQRHAQSSETEQRFLEKKLSELEKRIEKSEHALNDYRRQRGIVVLSLDSKDQVEDQDEMVTERISDLNKALVAAQTQRIASEADVETIKAGDYDSLPEVVKAPLIQNLKSEASRLAGEYAKMANEYTPDWPPTAQLHAQLMEVQGREQKEIRKIVDSIKLNYQSALDQENQLKAALEAEKAKAMSLKNASLRDVILSREVATNRTLYQNVLERIKVLGMASESQLTNVTVIDPAEALERPSSPNKRLCLVLSGFLALLLGLAAAFAIEASDRGLKNADEVQRYLHLPNLATVVHFPSLSDRSFRVRELLALRWRKGARPADEIDRSSPRTLLAAVGDAYRTLRTGILLSRSETPPKIILFTSAASGEGKSSTTVGTAIVFAQMVDRVLLIDADLRKPRSHTALNRAKSPGLTEILTGNEELAKAIQPTNVNGLYLLSAGLTPPNPTELLGSSKMRGILAEAAASFEYVLIDAPPILPVSDSALLSRLVDGVVVVVSALTAKPLVREGCSRLIYAGAKLLGVVLNNVSPEYQPYRESLNYNSASLNS